MGEDTGQKKAVILRGKSRMPTNSLFFEKVVPLLLSLLVIIMVGMVLFAAAVLLGFIQF